MPAAPTEIDLTRDLTELVRMASGGDTVEELLRRGLEWIGRVAPYDLATVFELQGDTLVVRAARGRLADARVRGHTLRLADFPSVRETLESRRARAFTEADHAEGPGDPFEGVVDLPHGHACMVVPLAAGDTVLGAATLDRAVCEQYPPGVVQLVEVYGQLLALALHHAAQRTLLERVHQTDRAHLAALGDERTAEATRLLDGSKNPRMRELVRRARQVAATDTPVLVLGETGTGKERLARALHGWSARAQGPFVALNCAAVPAGLLESELFGHVKGAFTGAVRDRAGRFQMANGGTLLLDEVGELPIDLQAKLLRVLQEGRFEPVGSDRTVKVDVRLLAATHVDLRRAIRERRFREDLFYRLEVFPLELLPLRDRVEDLPLACEVLLGEIARRTGRRAPRLSADALRKLAGHSWPGNLRELANVLERATILCTEPVLHGDQLDIPAPPGGAASARSPLPGRVPTLADVQREHIRAVLTLTHGRIYGEGGAAELLGLKPSTLQSKMLKLGVERAPGTLDEAERPG